MEDLVDLDAVDSRRDELERLRGGWLDGYGAAPAQAEWTLGDSEINVTFNSDGSLHLVAVDIDSGEASEATDVDPEEIARFVPVAA